LVIPATTTVALVDAARAHVPLSVIVTTFATVEPFVVPAHVPANAAPKVTVGVTGTVKADGNVTAIVSPAPSAPPDELLNPAVHDVEACAACEAPDSLTSVAPEPAPEMAALAKSCAVSADVSRA